MRAARIALALVGIGLLLYGAFRLLHLPRDLLLLLVIWLVAALLIHHGVLSPVVLGLGAVLHRFVPDRARTYVQGGLIVAAAVTVVAVPLIFREETQPPSKAMLLQDYGPHLLLLLAGIAVGSLIAYAVRVARDRRQPAAGRE